MMFGINNATAQTPQAPSQAEKIEVALESTGGEDQVVLRYLTWTEGLGWCSQKTIRVGGEHLDDLHRALTVARHRIGRRRAEEGHIQETAKVIQLPTLA